MSLLDELTQRPAGMYHCDGIARGGETRAVDAFLSAVENLSRVNKDPEFYKLALKAVKN